ncbi:Eisosome component PIL1-domain-containing protein [Chytriomyces sp. MP71]|nr:Eisosome component PIL1-domain-containing protein [Chytriomyces sp. MP71]
MFPWKKAASTEDVPSSPPGGASDGLHDGHGIVQGKISQGLGGSFVGGIRSLAATIKNSESRDLEIYIKEERDVVEAHTSLMRQRAGSLDAEMRWASTKEEDIRAISDKLNQIQQAFIQTENAYIESIEGSRKIMKEIRNREKKIAEAKVRLRQAVSKRDAAQKKNNPDVDSLANEARQIQADIRGFEADHLGLTRADFKQALRLKHEATVKYAVRLSVASKFSLYLADQIPQGMLSPGQDLPPFTGQSTLDQIMADFNSAFSSNELVTKIPAAAPAPTITRVPVDANAVRREELERSNSPAPSFDSEGGQRGRNGEPAEMFAARKPETYVQVKNTPYVSGKTTPPNPAPLETGGGYYRVENITQNTADVSHRSNDSTSSPQRTGYSAYNSSGGGYSGPVQAGYYSQYLPQQPVPQGYPGQPGYVPVQQYSTGQQSYYTGPPSGPPLHQQAPPQHVTPQQGYQAPPRQAYYPPPPGSAQYQAEQFPPPPAGAPPSYPQ